MPMCAQTLYFGVYHNMLWGENWCCLSILHDVPGISTIDQDHFAFLSWLNQCHWILLLHLWDVVSKALECLTLHDSFLATCLALRFTDQCSASNNNMVEEIYILIQCVVRLCLSSSSVHNKVLQEKTTLHPLHTAVATSSPSTVPIVHFSGHSQPICPGDWHLLEMDLCEHTCKDHLIGLLCDPVYQGWANHNS